MVYRAFAQLCHFVLWCQQSQSSVSTNFRHSDPESFPWDQPRWDLFFKCMYVKQVQGGQVELQPLYHTSQPITFSPFLQVTAGHTSVVTNVLPRSANSSMSKPPCYHDPRNKSFRWGVLLVHSFHHLTITTAGCCSQERA